MTTAATTTTKVIIAVNALFSVCSDRINDFLFSFRKQIDDLERNNNNHKKNPSSSKSTPTLIQAILGEDLDEPGIFHCHLKFVCSSSSISAQEDDDLKTRHNNIFLTKEPHQIWQDFESSPNAFEKTPEVYTWIVEPSSTASPRISNPKSSPFEKEEQQQQQQRKELESKPKMCCCCLNANLYIQPKHRDEFLNVIENARIKSIQEKYCVEYQYGESISSPNTFHVHQEYWGTNDGQDGLDQHCQTTHYQKWKEFSSKEPFTKSPVGNTFKTILEITTREHSDDTRNGSGMVSRYLHKGFPLPRYTATTNQDVLLLDGGNGHELKQRGVINDGSFLAGLIANENRPDVVKAVHSDFCDSGCQIITTNSFVAVPLLIKSDFHLVHPNDVQQRTQNLIVSAVLCAKHVAQKQMELHDRSILVAGTVPPLTECYIAKDVPESIEDLIESYKFILMTLVNAGVDVLLAETLSTQREAIAIIRAMSQIITAEDKRRPDSNFIYPPLWISFTIDDYDEPSSLRSGELLSETVDAILDEAKQTHVPLAAVGVNCASPRAVTRAIPYVSTEINKRNVPNNPIRIIAYANAFQTTTSQWLASLVTDKTTDLAPPDSADDDADIYDSHGIIMPEDYAKHAKRWRDLGASIIGGCCGCSPSHMKAVAVDLSNQKTHPGTTTTTTTPGIR